MITLFLLSCDMPLNMCNLLKTGKLWEMIRKCHFAKASTCEPTDPNCPPMKLRWITSLDERTRSLCLLTLVLSMLKCNLFIRKIDRRISSCSCTPSRESESIRTMARGSASSSKSILRRSNGTIRWSKEDRRADEINETYFKLSFSSAANDTSRFLPLPWRLSNFFDCNRHCWEGRNMSSKQIQTLVKRRAMDFQIG